MAWQLERLRGVYGHTPRRESVLINTGVLLDLIDGHLEALATAAPTAKTRPAPLPHGMKPAPSYHGFSE